MEQYNQFSELELGVMQNVDTKNDAQPNTEVLPSELKITNKYPTQDAEVELAINDLPQNQLEQSDIFRAKQYINID